MSDYLLLFSFSLILAGVFGADVVTVSVIEGDSLTLPINLLKTKDVEKLCWTFEDNDSVTIDVMLKNIDKKVQYNGEKFKNRLHVNIQNGSLTIPNITTQDTGKYKLEIKRTNDKILNTIKTFNVILNGEIQPHCVPVHKDLTDATDQFGKYVEFNCSDFILHRTLSVNRNDTVKSVSGVDGGTVILNTEAKTESDDVIEWKFYNTLIAQVDRRIPSDYFNKERFGDRLHVDSRGSLIITQIKTNESGLYDVSITNSKHIIQKKFNLTVSESSSRSHQDKIGPGSFVLVIMLVIVLV